MCVFKYISDTIATACSQNWKGCKVKPCVYNTQCVSVCLCMCKIYVCECVGECAKCVCVSHRAWTRWMGLDMANSSVLALSGLNKAHTHIHTLLHFYTYEDPHWYSPHQNHHKYVLECNPICGGRSVQIFYWHPPCAQLLCNYSAFQITLMPRALLKN